MLILKSGYLWGKMLSSYKIKLLDYVEYENIWEKIQEKQNKGKKNPRK